jgi:hypothetical protein
VVTAVIVVVIVGNGFFLGFLLLAFPGGEEMTQGLDVAVVSCWFLCWYFLLLLLLQLLSACKIVNRDVVDHEDDSCPLFNLWDCKVPVEIPVLNGTRTSSQKNHHNRDWREKLYVGSVRQG